MVRMQQGLPGAAQQVQACMAHECPRHQHAGLMPTTCGGEYRTLLYVNGFVSGIRLKPQKL